MNGVNYRSKHGLSQGYLLNSNGIASLFTEIIQQLCCTLIVILILAQRVDNPHLTKVDSSGESSGFGVSRDELDILNTASLNRKLV